MLVSELKEKYPLVYERLEAQTHGQISINNNRADVNNTLAWSSTTEGSEFWQRVHRYDIDQARVLQPHLFTEIVDDSPYKVITNGLFKKLNYV